MHNYPDGFNESLLDGPQSLADQVDPSSIIIEDPDNGLTIIDFGEDYNTPYSYLSARGDKIGLIKLAKELDIEPKQGQDLSNYLDMLEQDYEDDLDDIVMNAYDGIYGEDATSIPAR